MTAPTANGSYVNGGVTTVAANATDTVWHGVTESAVHARYGANLGAVVTGVGPAYSISWNTDEECANGAHTLKRGRDQCSREYTATSECICHDG